MALFGFVLSLLIAVRANFGLRNELSNARELAGFEHADRGGDSFLVSTVGAAPIDSYGTHLLRVESFEDYWLEISFYDGFTNKRKRTLVEIGDPIIAISYLPAGRSGSNEFLAQSTYPLNQRTFHQFKFSPHSKVGPFYGGIRARVILNECVFNYWYSRPEVAHSGPNTKEIGPRPTISRIENLCDKYKIQSVSFSLKMKHGG